MKLYKHQEKAIGQFQKRNQILAHDMGLGKTITAGTIGKGEKSLVICPARLTKSWGIELAKIGETNIQIIRTGKDELENTMWTILSYNMATAMREDLERVEYKHLFLDECFVGGTQVLTKTGYRNIENIKVGDNIISAYGEDIVKSINIRKVNEYFILKLSNKKTIKVTGNHLLFTNKGWEKVEDLDINTSLLHYDKVNDIIKRYEIKKMQILREDNTKKRQIKIRLQLQTDYLLFQELFAERQMDLSKRQNDGGSKERIHQQSYKTAKNIRKNEKKQSYEEKRNKRQSVENTKSNGTQTTFPRGKWSGFNKTARKIIKETRGWLASGIYCRNEKNIRGGLSKSLLNRHSKQRKDDSNRGGRIQSFRISQTGTRQKERQTSQGIGVESIKIQKQTNTNVYNLGVEGHPSYIVSDILAHNCHNIKGKFNITKTGKISGVKRSATAVILAKKIPHVILLTGTPILNKPIELWNQLVAVNAKITRDIKRSTYSTRYCGGHFKTLGRNIRFWWENGAIHLDELRERISMDIDILKKEEVLDLPEKVINKRIIEFTDEEQKEYDTAWDEYMKWIEANPEYSEKDTQNVKNAKQLVEIGKLKQITSRAKIKAVLDDIDTIEGQIVIFCEYVESLRLLNEGLKSKKIKYSTLKEENSVKKFQRGEVQVFTSNIVAGGTGLNLQNANMMWIVDQNWTPGVNKQAEDRIHRIGQSETAFITYYQVADSIDEKIDKINKIKQKVINKIIG